MRVFQSIIENRRPGYDSAKLIELLKTGTNVYDAAREIGMGRPDQIQTIIKSVRNMVNKGLVLPDSAFVRPKLMRGDYDAADMVNEILNRDEDGNLPTIDSITMNLKGDVTDALHKAIRVQVGTFQRYAKEAVSKGPDAVNKLALSWNVTPDRVRAVAATIGVRRGPSVAKLIRRQIELGNTTAASIFAAIKDQALDGNTDPKAEKSVRVAISQQLKKSRGTESVPQSSDQTLNSNNKRTGTG